MFVGHTSLVREDMLCNSRQTRRSTFSVFIGIPRAQATELSLGSQPVISIYPSKRFELVLFVDQTSGTLSNLGGTARGGLIP